MDKKRENILVEAEKLFAHFGIKKTTMDDISKNAKMGKSTMYYYFKNKEEIFAEIIRRDSVVFRSVLNQAIAKGKTPQEKISNYVLARMKHFRKLNNYFSTLTDEYYEQFAFVENVRKEFNEFEKSTLSALIDEGVKLGIFAVDGVENTARNLAICLKGLEYPLLLENGKSDIKNEANQVLKILFKGIESR